MFRAPLLFAVLLSAVTLTCQLCAQQWPVASAHDISFTIDAERRTYKLGEQVIFKYGLETKVTVNSSFPAQYGARNAEAVHTFGRRLKTVPESSSVWVMDFLVSVPTQGAPPN